MAPSQKLPKVVRRFPTVRLEPKEAVRWLAGLDTSEQDFSKCESSSPGLSGSLRYWSRSARLVLRLVERRHFVPDVRLDAMGRAHAIWRPALLTAWARDAAAHLWPAMPPVCHAARRVWPAASAGSEEQRAGPKDASTIATECATGPKGTPTVGVASESSACEVSNGFAALHPASIFQDFLEQGVNAVVREQLEKDAWSQHLASRWGPTAQTVQGRWLMALTQEAGELRLESDPLHDLRWTLRQWLLPLEENPRGFRLTLRLSPPDQRAPHQDAPRWRLSAALRSDEIPDLVIDLRDVRRGPGREAGVASRREWVRRSFEEHLAEVAELAPELGGQLSDPSTGEWKLSTMEAYRFLKEIAPRLREAGVVVDVPAWWGAEDGRLGMRLCLRPELKDTPPNGLGFSSIIHFDFRLAVGSEEVSSEDIERLVAQRERFIQVGNRWVDIDPDRVARSLDMISQHHAREGTLWDAFHILQEVGAPEAGLPLLEVQADGWTETLFSGDTARLEMAPVPAGFRGVLRPYQHRGLSWLSFLSRLGVGACLADDMGLGKTIQVIALLQHEKETESSDPQTRTATLLVVPMSLVGNWHREIERFAPSLRVLVHHGLERLEGGALQTAITQHDVVISTYGLVHRDFASLSAIRWKRIVLDEAQQIKNPDTKQARALLRLPSRHRVCLTGTPLENRLQELWSIFNFLNRDYLGSAQAFRKRFAQPIERNRDEDAARRLRLLIQPFMLRRSKSDPSIELELPDKIEHLVYCNLTVEQAAIYEQVTRDMLSLIDESSGIQRRGRILAAIMKLKQICNHPAQLLKDGDGRADRSGKSARLLDMLEEVCAESDKALVFTQFRQMGQLLKGLLEPALDREILFLHGGTSQGERDRLVERFESEGQNTPILLLSLRTGGFGLNLAAANHVFHFDRWWNPAVENQATDRAHRIGQKRHVQVHKFICIGTLEERIHALLQQKQQLADQILTRGEDWLADLSTDRLRELFHLSREAVSEGSEER